MSNSPYRVVVVLVLTMAAWAGCGDGKQDNSMGDAAPDSMACTDPEGCEPVVEQVPCGEETPGVPWTTDDPRLCFSSIIAGPNEGWSNAAPERGALVTVYGLNLGTERGDGFVSIGGIDLVDDADYLEWGNPAANPDLTKVSFWLHDAVPLGEVTMHITRDGATSNALPFRVTPSGDRLGVRDGGTPGMARLVFVDIVNGDSAGDGSFDNPYGDPVDMIDDIQPGDVVYFRPGTYNELYSTGRANINVAYKGSTTLDAPTQDLPLAFVGYYDVSQGESRPYFEAVGDDNDNPALDPARNFDVQLPYTTVANMKMLGNNYNVQTKNFPDNRGNFADYIRIVDCDCEGVFEGSGGTGNFTTHRSGAEVYGNHFYGAATNGKLEHAIYLNGCAPIEGADVAWNLTSDMQIDNGVHIAINHFRDRCAFGETMMGHTIRQNTVDCTEHPGAGAINVFSMSYDIVVDTNPLTVDPSLEVAEPGVTTLRNNLIIGCGSDRTDPGITGHQPAIHHDEGHARILDNILQLCVNIGIRVGPPSAVPDLDINRLSTEVRGNSVQMRAGRFTDHIANQHDDVQFDSDTNEDIDTTRTHTVDGVDVGTTTTIISGNTVCEGTEPAICP